MRVRHQGEKGAPVMANTLADGACQLVIGPIAGSGFRVRRDIGGNDSSRKSCQRKFDVTGAPCALHQGGVMLLPVMFTVTIKAAKVLHQVLAAGQPRRGRLKLTTG